MHRGHLIPAITFVIGFLSGALGIAGYEQAIAPQPAASTPVADSAELAAEAGADTASPSANVALPAAEKAAPEEGPAAVATPDASEAEPGLQAMASDWSRMVARLEGLHKRMDRLEGLQKRVAAIERRLSEASTPVAGEQPSTRARTPEDRRGALEDAGIARERAADIIWREGQYELEQLELRDQAMREGWFATDRYRQELQRLQDARVDLRAELGDEAYDRYLFAAGEENRVQVSSVIPGSAADGAGLLPGDVIETYDGARVFTLSELRSATADGDRDDVVVVTIRRADGSLVDTWVPRGPLGVHLDLTRVRPDA